MTLQNLWIPFLAKHVRQKFLEMALPARLQQNHIEEGDQHTISGETTHNPALFHVLILKS